MLFFFFRGNVSVKIAISGTPFHYGKLLVSYQPYPERNDNLLEHIAALSVYPTWRPLLMNYLSQSQGSYIIDVKENKPVILKIPFISTKPMHRLFNSVATVISDVTSYDDFVGAGSLYIATLNQVKAVTTTPSVINVAVSAWFEDVELGAPTASHVEITTEADFDERKVGPIERLSSQAAQVASALMSVPILQPYALASKMMLGGLSRFAALFGWSKPVIDKLPAYVKNEPFRNGANVIGVDTCKRITLDPKQELTVDGRFLGDGTDEMSISYLADIATYWETFTWQDSDTSLTPIFTAIVNPAMATILYDDPIAYFYQPTALYFATMPFNFWRGTITYRFDIVCSAFHRGKIAVIFEPNIAQLTLINSSLSLNKQFVRIVDIQETQSFEVCVEWAHCREWAQTATSLASVSMVNPTSGQALASSLLANGYITVVPYTELQSPDDSDVYVNVFVHSEDMQVNHLTYDKLPTDRRVPVEELLIEEEEKFELESDTSQDVSCDELNTSTAVASLIAYDHFGERPISFRALLKRYVHTSRSSLTATSATQTTAHFLNPIFPPNRWAYGATNTNPMDLLSYLRYAYVGERGSLRKRLSLYGLYTSNVYNQLKVLLGEVGSSEAPAVSLIVAPAQATLRGTVTFVPHTNGGIEVELPYYSPNLFSFSFANDLVGTNPTDDMNPSWVRTYLVNVELHSTTTGLYLVEETASGEDFGFYRFQGAPFFRRLF